MISIRMFKECSHKNNILFSSIIDLVVVNKVVLRAIKKITIIQDLVVVDKLIKN